MKIESFFGFMSSCKLLCFQWLQQIFINAWQKNEVGTTSGVLDRSIHRSSNELTNLEGSFSLYTHLLVYMVCLRGIPFCWESSIPSTSFLTQLLTHFCNSNVAGRRNLFWRCFAPCWWHLFQNVRIVLAWYYGCIFLKFFLLFLTVGKSWAAE